MTLARRLWLWGAAVPLAVVVVVLASAGFVFRGLLVRSMDRTLLNQAAVESVSLFDAPDGRPHLHLTQSPLEDQIRAFAAITWLYGPAGELLGVYPEETDFTVQDVPFQPTVARGPETRELQGRAFRVYTLPVPAPDGQPHAIQLAVSMAPVEAAVRAFVLTATGIAALLGLVLLSLQGWQARTLSARLLDVRHRLAALREGRTLPLPVGRDPGDEISEVQAALTQTAARLSEANAAQEQLVARAAHELRTPLALMRTTLDLALRRERSEAELRRALHETRREVDRLTEVAATLLELSAPEGPATPGEEPNADLRELLDEAVAAAEAQATLREVRIRVEGLAHAPARVDARGLRRALDNLLSNALRFSPAGGTVVLELAVRPEGGYVLAVEDAGPGIPLERREDVFRPFVRLEDDGEGAGLGLALVREVARRHGGNAFVDARERGARLVLELPFAEPAAREPATA